MEWTFRDVEARLLVECEAGARAERWFDEGEYGDFVRWLGELSEWAESFGRRHEARIARARLVVRSEAGATSDESFVGALDELLAWLDGRTAWAGDELDPPIGARAGAAQARNRCRIHARAEAGCSARVG